MNQEPTHRKLLRFPWLWTLLAFVLIVAFAALLKPLATPSLDIAVAEAAQTVQQPTHAAATNKEVAASDQTTVTKKDSTADTVADASAETHSETVAVVPSSDNCVACHTDAEKLKEVAEEPEVVKSEEAEGEG